MMAEERLQKIIARSGLCSRREADSRIREGRVTVDGQVAQLGLKVDPTKVHIKVDGRSLKGAEPPRYILLYKPREVMTTCDDPEERITVLDIVRPAFKERLFPVGRLDYHSEGLLLLTNDGELAARIAHPRYGVVREYLVKIRGDLSDQEYRKLLEGTSIEGHHVKPLSARRENRGRRGANSWWRVEVAEGRTHEVRELFFHAGHHVQRLRRIAIGPLRDSSLKPGEFRTLSEAEIKTLRRISDKGRPRATTRSRRTGSEGGQRRSKARAGRTKRRQ
jgi:23S rRNA pseudouridine2605 synthase